MLSLDLFDSKYERELREGAVDDLEYRRMNDLREKMEYLMQAYKKADTDEMRQAIMARYNEYKTEREGYMKVREQQVPSRQDPFAYVKPEPKGIGDTQDPKQKMAQLQQRSKKGALANVAAGIKAFVKGEPEPMGEADNPLDQLPLPSQTRPTPRFGTRTHAQNVYFEILKAWDDERDYIVIPFPNAPNPVTMIRGQLWNAIVDLGSIKDPKRRAKYVEERFNDFESFMSWLGNLKRYKVPAKKKGKTQSLPLQIPQQPTGQAQPTAPGSPLMDPEFTGIKPPGNLQEKKKFNDLEPKDVGLSRELQKARARFPAAASDLEAGILDQMDQQQQAQQALAQQQADLNRQDQQIAGLAQANQQQYGVMRAQGQEIDRLTQRLQQVMTQPTAAPATAPVTPQAEPTTPAAAPAPDMVYVPDVPADTATQDREIARLNKQIQQLELMMALKTPAERSDLEDRIRDLEKARAAQEEKKRATAKKSAATRQRKKQATTIDMEPAQAQLGFGAGVTDTPREKERTVRDPDEFVARLLRDLPGLQTGDQKELELTKEGKMNKIDVLRQELQRMGAQRFQQVYGMAAAEVMAMDRPVAQQDVPMQAPRFRDAQDRAQLEHSRMAEGQPQELIRRYLAIDAENDVDAVRAAIQAISKDPALSVTSKSRLLGQIGMIIRRHRLPIGRAYYQFMRQYMEDISETALNPQDPQGDYEAKRRALHDLSLNKDVDQAAVLQRRLDLDREAKAKGLAETVTNVKAGMAEIYRRLAPKIERHRDSFLAGQLYDELENYAELHGAEGEFKRMMATARNSAHMEYDTNPGGFQNWFWFLPFEDEQLEEIDRRGFLKGLGATAGLAAMGGAKAATSPDDPSWSKVGQPFDSSITTSQQVKQVPGQQPTVSSRIADVKGPNAKGEYLVTVVHDDDIVSNYVTKTPPKSWMRGTQKAYPQVEGMAENTDDVKKRMSKLEALALAANRAGDDAKCKMYQQKIQSLKQKLSQSMMEGATQLSVQQLATISDEALDNAYHYGRSQPGNTFGWQANLKSAAFAKQMIDKGVTDIEQIGDAIHKGWNVTAQAFVKNPQMFDDSKTMAPEKLQAKIAQRQKLMTQNYAELPEDEKEKDRVVARAMLQAIKGQQGVAESAKPGEYYVHTVYFKDGTKKRIRVTSDEFDVAGYYTKRGQAVDRVDYDFQIHSDVTEQFAMPGTTIPRKSVIQGYTVYWNPDTQMVSVTRGGDSEQAAIEQARVLNINKDRFLAAAYRMIDRIEELAENISREPRTARERDDMIDKIQRMMTQDRNPANLQIMKKDIEILKTKYRDLKEDSDSREAVEMAIMRRMLVAHTDLIMRHGLDVVVAAIEEVAEDVGEVDEIGTSDVSAYVRRVQRILEPDNEV